MLDPNNPEFKKGCLFSDINALPPHNLSDARREAVHLSAALPHVPPLTSPGLFRGTEQHFHSNYLID